ncbi:MAG TPA: hypothetical protein DDX04_19010, partial [Massilia sp.]|nr:hypothetical protein [Massilia sp.]
MRHLLALPFVCIALIACATPPAPQAPSAPLALTLEPGASAAVVGGVTLRFDEIEDSRCPAGVQCIWAGKLSGRFSLLRKSAVLDTFTLMPGDEGHTAASLAGARLRLDAPPPPPPAPPPPPPPPPPPA